MPAARRPLCPLNLWVNGDGRTPAYGTRMGVSVNWDRSDPRRNAEGPTETLAPASSRTVVELLTVGEVPKQTFTFAPTGPQTITNTQIVTALGAENDFMLRAWWELWKDSLGGWRKCTAAGTPGTWQQVLPAAVAADASSGTVPTGYLVLNVTTGTVKRHAGGYVWTRSRRNGGTVSAGRQSGTSTASGRRGSRSPWLPACPLNWASA